MVQATHHGTRKEKAVTLTETIIALSIIVLVSLATVTIVVSSVQATQSASRKSFFNHEIDTLSELYLSYPDSDDFSAAVLQYSGQNVTLGTDTTFYYDATFARTDEAGEVYHVIWDFTGADSLRLSAYLSDGNLIVERSLAR